MPNESSPEEIEQLRQQYAELKAIHEKSEAGQNQSEEALRICEHKFFILFEKSAFPTALSKLPDGTIVDINEAFKREFGLTKQEALGKTYNELGLNPDADGRKRIIEALKENNSVHRQEMVLFSKSGEKHYYETNIEKVVINGEEYLLNTIQNISKYKQAEKELQKSEEKYRNFFENDITGNYHTTTGGKILTCNNAFVKMLKYKSKDEIYAVNASEFYFENSDRDKFLNKLMAEKKLLHSEYTVKARDGSAVEIRENVVGVFDESGKLKEIVGYMSDITEQKKAQLLLNKSEKRFQNLFQNHSVVKLIIDPENGNIVEANDAASGFYGWTVGELKKMNIAQINTLQAAAWKKVTESVLALKKTSYEFKHRKADGSKVDVEVFSSNVDIDGKQFIHNIILDISEKKTAKEELLIHQQLLASVMDTQKELICRFLPDTTLTFVNKAYCKIFGKTEAGLLGRKFLELVPESSWVDILSNLKKLNEENPQITYEVPAFKPDGSVMTIEWTDIAIFNENGGLMEFQSVGRDITEKLITLNELIIAKEKAEESDKLKTAFINNISHEIRTPLNGILGFGQFMAESELNRAERVEMLGHVQNSANRLMNTVTDYMDMARIVSGTMEKHLKDFNLQLLFEEIIDNKKQLNSNKKINLEIEIPPGTAGLTVNTDIEFIVKIMGKLLDNAFKFTQQGSIRCGYKIKPGFVEFFVRDTGKGISSDKLELMFKMFIQEDPSMSRGYEGSGLGLAIARGLTTILGGEINVASVIGEGSEFTFTIPVHNSEKPAPADALKTNQIKNKVKPFVLIAEDDEFNYEYLAVVLKSNGFNHVHAINGAEAIDLCRQHPEISIVLMDIKMPVMNGIEATKQIREFRPELPIIAITAYAQTGDKHRFIEAGCNDYVAKPIKKDELIKVINKYFN
ncbi:MAG: hypothetical protein FD181_2247 [Prolixibacteraceae bacterium]|nr:MAG: hypothetical protein FD181_2247 [Prolixibacteraceae bacterium]